ncbi:hypothetical protein DMX30_24265 [Vibrio parahaemolyticus]|nr:hypothetical protein [Vibrio parahaemolyticus]MQD40951.1 hypothetical protein [Vibrio parahaemolyticus]
MKSQAVPLLRIHLPPNKKFLLKLLKHQSTPVFPGSSVSYIDIQNAICQRTNSPSISHCAKVVDGAITTSNHNSRIFSKLIILTKPHNALLRCEQHNTDASAYHLKH